MKEKRNGASEKAETKKTSKKGYFDERGYEPEAKMHREAQEIEENDAYHYVKLLTNDEN